MSLQNKLQIKELTHKMINDVMNSFDFVLLHTTMKAIDWKWDIGNDVMEVPTLFQIMEKAKYLLQDVMKYYGDGLFHLVGSGGLQASLDEDGCLGLQFVLCEGVAQAEFYDEYVPHNNNEQ